MKKIKIYLVADEMEVKQDELEISNFIRDLNDKFSKQDVYFKLITDDDLEEIDESEIKSSEMFFIIFCKKMNDETVKKFNIAYNSFIKENTPKISTYIKEINEEKDESLTQFLTRLGDELGHYYSVYNNVDTIKLNVVLKLKALGIGEEEIDTKDGKLYINDREILSLDKIPIILNNKDLADLKKELNKLEEQYFTLKAKLSEDDDNDELFEQFSKVSSKRNETKEAIFDLEKKIIELESSFVKISNEGKMSIRQIHAKKALEEGNIEVAKEILDVDSIVEDANKKIELKALKDQDIMVNINEMLQRIGTLGLDVKNKNRFKEIEECFEIATSIEKKGGLYPKTLLDYANYLISQRKSNKSLEQVNSYIKYVEYKGEIENLNDLVNAYNILLTNYGRLNENKKLFEYVNKALQYAEKLEDNYFKALVYSNVGVAYMFEKRNDEAEKYLLKAIKIKKKIGSNAYGLIIPYTNLTQVYIATKRYNEAEDYIKKSLQIVEEKKLDESNVKDMDVISHIFENGANLYSKKGDLEKAKQYAEKTVAYRKEMYEYNPEEYGVYLARSYKERATIEFKRKNYKEAEKHYIYSLEILDKIVEADEELYSSIYDNLAVLYMNLKKYKESLKCFDLAIEFLENLLNKGREIRKNELAECYSNKAIIYAYMEKTDKVEENLQKTLEIIEKFDEKDEELMQKIYGKLAAIYTNQEEYELASKYFDLSIEIVNGLIEKGETKYKANLAELYFNQGFLYDCIEEYEKSAANYEISIQMLEELAEKDIYKYGKQLADKYELLADIYLDEDDPMAEKFKKEFLEKAKEIREKIAK